MSAVTDERPLTEKRGHGDATALAKPDGKGVTLRRLLREPLLHFVLIGLVVFGAYGLGHDDTETSVDTRRIEITVDDMRQMAVAWLAQGRPAPTAEEMLALIDQKVTSEVLFREAIDLGLDRDDEIIKRRLAQKMDFLVADVAAMAPPTAEELETWFGENAARFALPAHISFRHLYFSFDGRGEGARDAAVASLGQIAGRPPGSPEVASVADPFMFRNYYGDASPDQMAKEFGPAFADALFKLTPGSWQGPIESGYGWHLIWIDSLDGGRIPAFEEVKPAVMEAWQDERYREVKQRALDEMRSRYTVVTPPLDALDSADFLIPPSAQPELPAL